jgi:hypothetical protein
MSEKSRARSAAYKANHERLEKLWAEQFAATHGDPVWKAGFDAGTAAIKGAYARLEDQNAKLLAKVYGYVNRMASEPPDKLLGEPRRGNEWRKIWWRTPYLFNEGDGTWTRAKGQVKREDYAQKFPPRACANCGHLFPPARSDARTCSPACRKALQRKNEKARREGRA